MNMPTNKPSLKEKLYQETMFHEGDPEQSVFPDAVSMDTANQRIKLAIEKTEAEARADTAKQIFKELEAMTLKASGTCNIPMCVYGDEAEEQYFKLKKKYNIED